MTAKNLFENPDNDLTGVSQSDFNQLLEMDMSILGSAASSNDCADLLIKLALMAEKLLSNSVASIMLYNISGKNLHVRVAPSLPAEAIMALNGLQIGEGSCGNAVYHNEDMYVCNTSIDKRWDKVRDFAKAFNVHACWSSPIRNDANEPIGSFALSSFEVRKPTDFQRRLLSNCASIAGILLLKEKHQLQKEMWEKEALKLEKLESIGVLAGGIAHDFNNLLGIIMGNIDMTTQIVDSNSKPYAYMRSAEKATRRAVKLTQQLLTFSKGGNPIKKPSDLLELVRESAEFVLHGSNVISSINCECENNAKTVIAVIDSGQIGQVFQNIVLNARQAMPDGGEIKISCSSTSSSGNHNHKDFLPKARRFHKIKIADNGYGIAKNDLQKIFDPYFTTKSNGNGLGLASSFSIVQKHGGYLCVDSEPDKGACFTVYLPMADGQLDHEQSNRSVTVKAVRNSKRIMVMDDQQMLLDVAEAMIESLGYQVVKVNDGAAALEKYKAAMNSANPIDLIILDLTIPGGMGGIEAAQEILALDTNAKVIVSSGYSTDSIMSNYPEYGFRAAISKPYDMADLKSTLDQVLDN